MKKNLEFSLIFNLFQITYYSKLRNKKTILQLPLSIGDEIEVTVQKVMSPSEFYVAKVFINFYNFSFQFS